MKSAPAVKTPWSDTVWTLLTIAILTTVICVAGYTMVQQQKQFLIREKQKEIATIADLKTAQLVQWRKERFAEGASIRANAMLARRVSDYLQHRDSRLVQQEFQQWLSNLVDLGEYSKAMLFAADGSVISSYPQQTGQLNQHYYSLVEEATSDNELILSNFHSDGPGDPYDINLAIPILQANTSPPRCLAVLIFDIDPTKRLYPLIQSWPTASATAETLLVMRKNDSALFLNDLRHRTSSSTPFQVSLNRQEMPAVKAALGQEGVFHGRDYRDVAVLGSTRVIPGTQWGLVAKIDVAETLESLSTHILMIIIASVVLIISMVMGVLLLGIRRKAATLRRLVEIEQNYNSELKASEESLIKSRDYHLKLLEIFPSLIWRSGTDAKCDYFNQTWLQFTGRSIEQELGDGWLNNVHPDDRERCVAVYSEAFAARQEFNLEYRLRFNDDSYRWISDHGRPYYDLDEKFAGFIGSGYDINVQKNAETELQGIHARLEHQIETRTSDLSEINMLLRSEISERKLLEQQLLSAKRLEAIGQIAGGVAHEVRNPLNAILTITEALFREEEIASNPEFEPFILHIRAQVNRLVHLMNDLLDLGRTIPATNLQPLPLYDVCNETLYLWKTTGMSKNKQALLTIDCDSAPLLVLADAIKLQQVFFNLLENAGHHTPEGSRITMRITTTSEPTPMALVQVIDQGSGIAEDKLAHVFDPFYTGRQGGTGLGLALVRHFTENMAGTVQLWNNEPPPGCTVQVRIPLYSKENL